MRWEFPNAAVPAGRCPRCAFPPEACLCPEIPRLQPPVPFLLLRHASEIPRMTNSGRWAAAAGLAAGLLANLALIGPLGFSLAASVQFVLVAAAFGSRIEPRKPKSSAAAAARWPRSYRPAER